jgi:hypothetical protein
MKYEGEKDHIRVDTPNGKTMKSCRKHRPYFLLYFCAPNSLLLFFFRSTCRFAPLDLLLDSYPLTSYPLNHHTGAVLPYGSDHSTYTITTTGYPRVPSHRIP